MRRLSALAALLALSPAPAIAQSNSAVRITPYQQQAQGSLLAARQLYSITATPAASEGGGFLMIFAQPVPPADGPVEPMMCFHVASGPSSTSATLGSNPATTALGFSWAYSTAATCQQKIAAPINHLSIAWR